MPRSVLNKVEGDPGSPFSRSQHSPAYLPSNLETVSTLVCFARCSLIGTVVQSESRCRVNFSFGCRVLIGSGITYSQFSGQDWPWPTNLYKLCDAFGCIDVLGRRSFLLDQLVSKDRQPGIGRSHARSMVLGALQETWGLGLRNSGP